MKVQFYATASGRSPVEVFISELSKRLRAAVLVALEQVREFGLGAPGVSFRQIEGKLWELRIQAGAAARLFYVVVPVQTRPAGRGGALPMAERSDGLRLSILGAAC